MGRFWGAKFVQKESQNRSPGVSGRRLGVIWGSLGSLGRRGRVLGSSGVDFERILDQFGLHFGALFGVFFGCVFWIRFGIDFWWIREGFWDVFFDDFRGPKVSTCYNLEM